MENSFLSMTVCTIYYILSSFILYNIFKKGKVNKWLSLVPIVREIKLLNLVDLKWYNIFIFLFSPVNLLFWIYMNIKLSKKFNKSNGFTVGMILLAPIFYLILAVDKSKFNYKKEYSNKKFEFVNLILLFVSFIILALVTIPILFKNITKGLDLAGGFEILYQIKSADGKKVTSDQVQDTYRTMQRRIDKLGVSEPEITIEGNDKIRVKLAGITDPDEARNYITVAGELSFRDSDDNKLMDKSVLKQGSAAKVSQDDKGNPAILLNIADKDTFYNVTNQISQTKDQLIVIWLDFDQDEGDSYIASKDDCGNFEDLNGAKCLSAATVKEAFSSNVIITGNFSETNAKNLVDLINSGSTNVKFKEISSKTVGSAFGEGSLEKTELASVIGISLIVLFMIVIYRFSGFIASGTILIYTSIILLVFYLIDGVLTLPGIAAIVLGIGMAVDANVITSERVKEELRKGRSLKLAFKKGSSNSLSAILDSNITTFIVAVILFAFGESSVKGFATMLIINIIMTMLIVIVVTRLVSKAFIENGYFNDKLKAFINLNSNEIVESDDIVESAFEKKIKFDFVKNFSKFLSVSVILVVIGLVFSLVSGFNFGIDFAGGSNITLSTDKEVNKETITNELQDLKLNLTDFTKDNNGTDYYLTISNTLSKNQIKKVNDYFEKEYKASTEISVVSNLVKKDLIRNAIISLIFAIIGIIIYISIRYTKNYAVSAVIALAHDVIMIFAMFAIFKFEINSIFIAAILTILGYSINNTIVIFDRIRENMNAFSGKKMDKNFFNNVVNLSVKETLLRSINTTITTLFPIVCLMIFGAKEIITFDIAILIGLLAGGYSSVLLSSQIWSKIELRSQSNKTKKEKDNSNKNKPKKENKKSKKKPKKETRKLDELSVKGINA